MAVLLGVPSASGSNRYELARGTYTIGRATDCAIVLPGNAIGLHHARISWSQGKYILEDLGSRNGTHLNGHLVSRPVELQSNDRIAIADFQLIFQSQFDTATERTSTIPTGGESPASNKRILLRYRRVSRLARKLRAEVESLAKDNDYLRREAVFAGETQRSMLTRALPVVPGYEFFASIQQAREVGGDLYDFITLDDGRLLTYLADISGKGTQAALLASFFAAEARHTFRERPDLKDAMRSLNRSLIEFAFEKFITIVVAVLDQNRNHISLINAGFTTPYLLHGKDNRLEAIEEQQGPPLGVLDEWEAAELDLEMNPSDCLLLYSDGFIDSSNVHDQLFGDAGIRAIFVGPVNGGTEIGSRLIQAVRHHEEGRPPNDDRTVVCIGRSASSQPGDSRIVLGDGSNQTRLMELLSSFVVDPQKWLAEANPQFGGRSPGSLIGTAEESQLFDLLHAVEHGLF